MRKRSRVLSLRGGAAAALCLVCERHVQAQLANGGSVQAPEPLKTNTNPVPPSGPQLSKTPLATEDQFTNAKKQAPNSVPTGTPGISK
jgi:hypothetical protein